MVDTREAVEEHQPKQDDGGGGFIRFWSTMPGVLTALAGVITALGTLYLGMNRGADDPKPVATHGPTTPVLEPSPGPAPTTTVAATAATPVPSRPVPANATTVDPVTGCAQGNTRDCATVLDRLVTDCRDLDDGWACDMVYEVTDPGSELEWLGATCGYEFTTDLYAGSCESVL
jgi:hypothetical protein